MNRKNLLFLATGLLVLVVAGMLITLPPVVKKAKLIEIPEKANGQEIAAILKYEGIIRRGSWFLFLTNRMRVQDKLQAGVYEFQGRISLRRVIEKLVKGQVAMLKITIPEGATIRDIGRILEGRNIVSAREFVVYADKKHLEGFLYPETYFFPLNVSMETVANTALSMFEKRFAMLYGKPVTMENNDEVKKIVTIASIIEKEAEADAERSIIASVIANRLKRRMPLQSCSTVEYALGRHKARLRESDLRTRSPYNTYLHYGLPPGPICSPGKASLVGALAPAKTDYLFFVTKGDGTHYFSRTHAEHLRARQLFLDAGTQPDTSSPALPAGQAME